MVRSMTGFGRFETDTKERKITVEMKGVNHRYLELSIKLPKKLSFFEVRIRTLLKQYISRGKVDVFITYEDVSEGRSSVHYNEDLAAEYFMALTKMSERFGIENDVKTSLLAQLPEVFTLQEQTQDEEELFEFVEQVIEKAAGQFVEMREKEGTHLKKDILFKLDGMIKCVEQIEEHSPKILEEYKKKLSDKITELLGDVSIDETRITTEVTIFADKICVDEETVRLKAHIKSMKDTLEDGLNIGRKLDFIAQEMNREANTILSKANDLTITELAIQLKTEIEKIREQIQNIE